MRLFAGTELVGFAAAAGFNGFYTYDFVDYGGAKFVRLCRQAHARGLLCVPSVGPGYDGVRAGELSVSRPRRDGATYDHLWKAAIAAHPDGITITSYNEWGEGTQIEPAAAKHGYLSYNGSWGLHGVAAQMAYLDADRLLGGPLPFAQVAPPYTLPGWRLPRSPLRSRSFRTR